ncbi:MAG: hypothetical protein WAU47_09020 [Desulfobaccales bacterium]
MPPENKGTRGQDRKAREHHWLPPCRFLGPLTFSIASLNFKSSMTEHEAVLRFTNQYGIKISEHVINQGLFFVSVLHFFGPNDDDYEIPLDSPLPEMTCFNSSEVLHLSEEVARWEKLA